MGRVGEYEIGKTIATGAFSKVKLAVHEPTGKTFVAKILPKTNKDVENDIRVEISILRKVRHENVVQLIEILESPRNYYIILEPVLGGDLCNLVMEAQDGLEEPIAGSLFCQLVEGLHACHRNGVAHRDLKPENILLTPERRVKISDFGLSRLHKSSFFVAQASELAQTLTGTLAYVAPEVLSGQHYDAFKADMWSLGCMLFVMLTGRFPFGGAQGEELQRKILAGDVAPIPSHVSPAARHMIDLLMKHNPKERPSLDLVMGEEFYLYARAAEAPAVAPDGTALVTGTAEPFAAVDAEDDQPASPPMRTRPKRVFPGGPQSA